METSLAAAIVPGLGLGGVLAAAGAWSRAAAGNARLPHFGVGALAGVAVLFGSRVHTLPTAVILMLALLLGGALGFGAFHVDRQVRQGIRPHPGLPDVAVVAGFLAIAVMLQTAAAVPLPLGPLGGRPGVVAGLAAFVLGTGGAVALTSPPTRGLHPSIGWALSGALLAGAAVLGAGVLGGSVFPGTALVALPDTAGLALRAVAAGLIGRRGPTDAALAGVGLGLAEALLRTADPFGALGFVPALLAGAVGFAWWWRTRLGTVGARL